MKSQIKNDKGNNNANENEIEIEIELALSKTFPTNVFMESATLSNLASNPLVSKLLATKLLQNTGVVAVSIVAYKTLFKLFEPFSLLAKSFNIAATSKTDAIAPYNTFEIPDISYKFISTAESLQRKYNYSDKQIERTFKIFNKYFSFHSISELRKRFSTEVFNWNKGALDHIFFQETDPSYKIPEQINQKFQLWKYKYIIKLRDVLYDDNIVNQHSDFVKQFFNTLLFILENHSTMVFLGIVGGSVLLYNGALLRRRKMDVMKKDELKTNVLEDFSKIINVIAKEHGLTQVFEYENTKHMFSKYELVIPRGSSGKERTEKIRQFKMFLQIIPPNVFIHEATFDDTQIVPKDKDVKEDMDANVKSIKKYIDIHIERYVYRYPKTISQRIKRYIKNEPRFSPNVNR